MSKVKLKWIDRSIVEDGFRVYRDTKPIDIHNLPEPLAELPPNTEEFEDEGLLPYTKYHYVIGTYRGSENRYSAQQIVDTGLMDRGPGPQNVIGSNGTEGYFGELASSELITGDALASLVGLTGGTSQNSTTNWLKFFIDGKIVFVSKKNIRNSVSWDMLNAANVINGSRIITIGQYQYRIGLLKGLNPDTSVPYTQGYDVPSGLNSEWNRLMYPVSSDEGIQEDRQKHSQTIPNWANFPQDDSEDGLNISVGNGRYSWVQETNPTNTSYRVIRGSYSVAYLGSGTSSVTSAICGWRARLELVTS